MCSTNKLQFFQPFPAAGNDINNIILILCSIFLIVFTCINNNLNFNMNDFG